MSPGPVRRKRRAPRLGFIVGRRMLVQPTLPILSLIFVKRFQQFIAPHKRTPPFDITGIESDALLATIRHESCLSPKTPLRAAICDKLACVIER